MNNRILIVDDEPNIRKALDSLLTHKGYAIDTVGSPSEAMRKLRLQEFDVMITDLKLNDERDGLQLLREVREKGKDLTTIMITGHGSVDIAVQAMKAGAFDFVTKPFRAESLLTAVQNAFTHRQSCRRKPITVNEDIQLHFGRIVGESPEMQKVYKMIGRVSKCDATVLIQGESGTGKELVAEAIHRTSSRRSGGPYVPLNCAALSTTLLESEMFGHVSGAFTGASKTRNGLFMAADKGTLFLDEIECMDLGIQSKLLRVLQENKVRRVGDTEQISVDVRVIAATNERLENKRDTGEFREDLYYRISVIPITLPPLRWRVEDIALLTRFFCTVQTKMLGFPVTFKDDVLEVLRSYAWPGNVRELQNAIACASALCVDGLITVADLPPVVRGIARMKKETEKNDDGKTLRNFLQLKEREYIQQMLNRTSGDLNKAAEMLGISRATMYRKLPDNLT